MANIFGGNAPPVLITRSVLSWAGWPTVNEFDPTLMSATKCQLLLVAAAILGTGCNRSLEATSGAPSQERDAQVRLVHDAGTVLAGVKVEHVFDVTNPWDVAVRIVDDLDIEKSCGCLTLEPSKRCLSPGERATIRMTVNTHGKHGHFRVGGLVRWKSEAGKPWPVQVFLEGAATGVLTARPGLVQFSREEVAAKSVKDISIYNGVEIDWSQTHFQVDPPYAELVEQKVFADHIRLSLKPCPPTDVVEFSATLHCGATLAPADHGVEQSVLAIPVQGVQAVDLQVMPRAVFGSWSAESKKATARFLVRGRTVGSATDIHAISCDGFEAAWVAREVESSAATEYRTQQIELSLSELSQTASKPSQSRTMHIAFVDGQSLKVPIYLVTHQ